MKNEALDEALKALEATPEYKIWGEAEKAYIETCREYWKAEKALEKAKKARKKAKKAYKEADKVSGEAEKVLDEAKNAVWETPEWKDYMESLERY